MRTAREGAETMKTDQQLKNDVQAELAWDPAVDERKLGVGVADGVVTLSGVVDTYRQKTAAAVAVRRVAGVRGIAMDIEVRLAPDHRRGDAEIAAAASHALRWNAAVPQDHVTVEVDDGWVTLTGEAEWPYQAAAAEHCVAALLGVRGVSNLVTLRRRVDED
ncbi:MAG: BON domain-containing protein, partial [Comamonadaceae bacterium]